mgnify:CR=1 FL=1
MQRAFLMKNVQERNSDTYTPFYTSRRCHHCLRVRHLCKDNSSDALIDICEQHCANKTRAISVAIVGLSFAALAAIIAQHRKGCTDSAKLTGVSTDNVATVN